MAILTLDQRLSRESGDLVDDTARELNNSFRSSLEKRFVRTAGDEMQAVVTSPAALVDIVLRSARDGSWWVGVGLGSVEKPLGRTARDSRGPAFWNAREAVARAKQRAWRCAVVAGEAMEAAEDLEATLAMLIFIVDRRSERGWEMIDLISDGLNQTEIADRLGISKQAVSKVLLATGREEERRGREVAQRLLSRYGDPAAHRSSDDD